MKSLEIMEISRSKYLIGPRDKYILDSIILQKTILLVHLINKLNIRR